MREAIVFCALLAALAYGADTGKWQTSEDGSRYFIETENQYNWFEALHECAQRNMTLFIIDSSAKHEKMDKFFKTILANVGARLYMAGHENAAGGHQYVWLTTGKAFSFNRWFSGEPNHETELCAEVQTSSMNWNNVPCSTKLGYACEELPLVSKKNQELVQLKTLLKDRDREVDALKKSYESQINEMKGKNMELDAMRKFFETLMNQLSKEKSELLNALTKSYESQKIATAIPYKNYNIVINPKNCTSN